jgi:outer membrane protein assembly factor BamA
MAWAAIAIAVALSAPGEPTASPGAVCLRSATGGFQQAAPETVTSIQIQGNTATSDDDVRRLAGVSVGMPLAPTTLDEVAARLRATKRFEQVEVRKRFASIDDPSQIVLVILVDEGRVQIEMTGNPSDPTRVVRSRRPKLMFLPVLEREDGYGFTYGARFAIAGPAGAQSHIAFPLTWGGTKQAAAELDKSFAGGPVSRILAGGSMSRRTNPFYEEDDDRARAWVRGERVIARALRLGATAGFQRVSFFDSRDTFAHAGADAVLDTRLDPFLPRNAVYARAAWDRFNLEGGAVARSELEGRGYVGLIGQTVLALRALRSDSSGALPPYLQPLLGGMATLRGFEAGHAAGDSLVATSAELFVPLTSPLEVAKIGVSVFADAGTVYPDGERLSDQALLQGYGGSVWLTAAVLRLNLAVAHGRGASTRVHVGLTLAFSR